MPTSYPPIWTYGFLVLQYNIGAQHLKPSRHANLKSRALPKQQTKMSPIRNLQKARVLGFDITMPSASMLNTLIKSGASRGCSAYNMFNGTRGLLLATFLYRLMHWRLPPPSPTYVQYTASSKNLKQHNRRRGVFLQACCATMCRRNSMFSFPST